MEEATSYSESTFSWACCSVKLIDSPFACCHLRAKEIARCVFEHTRLPCCRFLLDPDRQHRSGFGPGYFERIALGVAKIDITFAYPIRLSGFGQPGVTESEGVASTNLGKAHWPSTTASRHALITVDNVGVPAALVTASHASAFPEEGWLGSRASAAGRHRHAHAYGSHAQGHVVHALWHAHSASEHQEPDRLAIRRNYSTSWKPSPWRASPIGSLHTLSWGIGRVGFATNRRTIGRTGRSRHALAGGSRQQRGNICRLRQLRLSVASRFLSTKSAAIGQGSLKNCCSKNTRKGHCPGIGRLRADSNPSSRGTGDKVEAAACQELEIAGEVKGVCWPKHI